MWARRVGVGLLGLAVCPFFVVNSAGAQTLEWTDPTGDMWYTYAAVPFAPAPEQTRGDGTRMRVRLSTYALTIRQWFRDFALDDYQGGSITLTKIRTNEGLLVELHFGNGTRGLVAGLEVFDNHSETMKPLPCRNLVWSADTVQKSSYVRIPRNCLSRPRWVRVASESHYRGQGSDEPQWFDDLHGTGISPAPRTEWGRFSSRVWRGGN
jgi:hypothetical protein